MPARLAAMPITPAERGAGTRTTDLVAGTREAERLARSIVREEATWAFATRACLATPRNPMFPNDGEANGACAADGAAIARVSVTVGIVVLATVVNGAADAGRAKEATMPPETAITAEALAAGLAVRPMAAEREDAVFKRCGPR